jgi:hypothetical protein
MLVVAVEVAAVSSRLMDERDEEWLSHLLRKRYAENYNVSGTENWLRNWVWKRPDIYHGCRTRNAFCISLLTKRPWAYESECSVMMICGEGQTGLWECLTCLKLSIEWGRMMKATTWKLASDTEFDLAPVARYLGLEEISPRFVLRY